ncbi:hypothetical protein K7432_018372, partial [Basidiobolus ranarum]
DDREAASFKETSFAAGVHGVEDNTVLVVGTTLPTNPQNTSTLGVAFRVRV